MGMNRKGASMAEWGVFSIWDVMQLIIYLLGVGLLVWAFSPQPPDLLAQEAVILQHRLLHTPGGISYIDPITQQVHPHIIDTSKFMFAGSTKDYEYQKTINALSEQLYYGGNYIAANITLLNPATLERHSLVLNERWYKRWQPIAYGEVVGEGEVSAIKDRYSVLMRRGGALVPAQLTIEVVTAP